MPEEIQAALDAICPKHGAKKATLFGSYAHGMATEGSDVDVLVELEGGQDSFDAKIRMGIELEERLGVYVDVLVAPLPRNSIFVLDENGVPKYMHGSERDERLIPILLQSIERIRALVKGTTLDDFKRNEVLGDAVSLRIIKLTERMKNGFFERHPAIPRERILKMRNVLAHEYLNEDDNDIRMIEIDYEKVWSFLYEVIFPLESLLQQ